MNARDHVLALADQLVEQGREVEIEEEHDSIRIFARARNLAEHTVAAHAFRLTSTSRWTFGGVRVYRIFGDPISDKRRNRAHILVDVYGRSYSREAVAS